MSLVIAVLPRWAAEARPTAGARETVAYALLRAGTDGDLRARLLDLPQRQVEEWRARMPEDPDPGIKRRAKELA